MTSQLPRIIAHRGASHSAPENTLAAMQLAYHENARWVEVDVKLSSDAVPLLMHDDTLERTTDASGMIADHSMAELQLMDAGSWLNDNYRDEPIPRLAEILNWAKAHEIGLNIEIKPNPGEAEATVAAVTALLSERFPDTTSPPILFSSFKADARAALQQYQPSRAHGYLTRLVPDDWQDMAQASGAWSIHVNGNLLHKHQAEQIKRAGYPLFAYTINEEAKAEQLFEWGIDAIITDRPGAMLEASSAWRFPNPPPSLPNYQ